MHLLCLLVVTVINLLKSSDPRNFWNTPYNPHYYTLYSSNSTVLGSTLREAIHTPNEANRHERPYSRPTSNSNSNSGRAQSLPACLLGRSSVVLIVNHITMIMIIIIIIIHTFKYVYTGNNNRDSLSLFITIRKPFQKFNSSIICLNKDVDKCQQLKIMWILFYFFFFFLIELRNIERNFYLLTFFDILCYFCE